MTDNEIIKALECCKTVNTSDCNNCPYRHVLDDTVYSNCCGTLMTDALSLINCQKAEISVKRKLLEKAEAEIERLQKHNTEMARKQYQDGKTEAIKEFAERLHDLICPDWAKIHEQIDNLVKEFTEEP